MLTLGMETLLTSLITPAVIGIAEIAKRSGVKPRWIPLIDLAAALILAVPALLAAGEPWWAALAQAIIIGAAACGCYSGYQNLKVKS